MDIKAEGFYYKSARVVCELANILEAFNLFEIGNRDSVQCFFLLKIDTKAMTEGQIRQLSSLHSLKAQIFTPKLDLDLGKRDGNWDECPSLTAFWVERGFITSTQRFITSPLFLLQPTVQNISLSH